MKLRTALLFAIAFLTVWVFYAFFQSQQNAQILSSYFEVWGWSFKVLNGFLLAMLFAAVVPACYFSWKYLLLARTLKIEKKAKAAGVADQKARDLTSQLLDHGRYELLLEKLQDREDTQAQLLKGKALLYLHRPSDAIQPLREAFAEGECTEAGYLLAKAYRSNGQSPVVVLEQLIEQDPKNASRAYRLLLENQDREQLWDACLSTLATMKKLAIPVNEETLEGYQFESIQASLKDSPKKAIDRYQQLLKSSPDFVPAYVALGKAHVENEAQDKALTVWEQGYSQTQDAIFLNLLEQNYLEQARPEDALQIYREILIREEQPVVRYRLANLYLKLEMLDESLESFEMLRPSFDSVPGFLPLVANIYAKRGRETDAYMTLAGAPLLTQGESETFLCRSCGNAETYWQARCGQCRQWNRVALREATITVETVSTAPLYY